ncbi:unnamed protein product [Sphagnum balticum]
MWEIVENNNFSNTHKAPKWINALPVPAHNARLPVVAIESAHVRTCPQRVILCIRLGRAPAGRESMTTRTRIDRRKARTAANDTVPDRLEA